MKEILHQFKRFKHFLPLLAGMMLLSVAVNGQTVTSDKDDYAPGETAIITGEGWTGDDYVDIHFEETPFVDHIHDYHDTQVNPEGTFRIEFPILERHLGVAFTVHVKGKQTGRTAVTEFTDANVKFSTTGLPPSVNVTVSYSGFSPPSPGTAISSSVTFSTGGGGNGASGNIALINDLTFSYPATIAVGNVTYALSSTAPTSPSTVPSTGSYQIEGTYIACNATSITNAPTAKTITYGDANPTYSVTATGSGLGYQWQYNTTDLPGTWNNVGTNSSSYTVPSPTVSFSGRTYRVVITGTCGTVTSTPVALTVNKKDITGSFTAANKTYDGNTSATVLTRTLNGVLAADAANVSLSGGTATFANVNAGNGKTVTLSGASLTGSAAGNYNLTSVGTTTANILALDITGSFTADNKTYDGNTSAAVLTRTLNGVISPDAVTLTGGTATFSDKDVANGKTVTLTGATLSGADAGNYILGSVATATADITALEITGNFTADNKIYDGNNSATVLTRTLNGVISPDAVTLTGGTATFSDKDVANGKTVTLTGATLGGADAGNYSLGSVATATADITPASLTITANNATKHEGQVNPSFAVTYSGFVNSENEAVLGGTLAFSTVAVVNSCAGVYDIIPSGLTSGNYAITFKKGTLTVTGLTIDASASSTPVALGSDATLKATVSPAVSGVAVSFYLDEVLKATSLTDADGTATLVVSGLAANVYKVRAVVAGGCAESIAYLPVYDPNGGFVTGGGWINSPAGAYLADKALVGKANFGFVSKYKKGSNQVDGNTEFQFKAGDLNFKSTMHESGSLVIAGKKAIYRGVGTINGISGYKFVITAIDGNITGGTDPDSFRIKISDNYGVVYDNGLGADENSDVSTVLGGGSIVIHEVKAKGTRRIAVDLIEVVWNTPIETISEKVESMSKNWFEGRKLALKFNGADYNPLTPGFYELTAELEENPWFELNEPISIQVLVMNKPEALDITISNDRLSREMKTGQVIGSLETVDQVDNIHTYEIIENDDVILQGNQLIWTGTSIPSATVTVTVMSTDRAGQTISREIRLSRELKPGEFFLYPNPAQHETNVMVDLDKEATVAIRIYDAVGRLIMENEAYREASFTQTFSLDGIAPGLYTVQVKAGNMVMTKRLIKK